MKKLCMKNYVTQLTNNDSSKYFKILLCSLISTVAIALVKLESQAVQYPDGKLAFESAVLLIDTHATFNEVRARQAKYYFDLELPDNIGEPLGKIVIQQRSGADQVRFKLDRTKVYFGTHNSKQEEIDSITSYNEATGEITIRLKQVINPDNSLTIALKPKRNPDYAGVYLFGITAFPPGKDSLGLYLGAGRFQIYQSDRFYF